VSEWLVAVRLRQLGDVLAALEPLRALKAYRPERRIAYVVDAPYVELLRGVEFIDALPAPPRSGAREWGPFLRGVRRLRAPTAVDFHGSARSALIALASGARTRVGFAVRVRRLAYTVVEPRGEFRDGRRVPYTSIESGMRLARHLGADAARPSPPRLRVTDEARERNRSALRAYGVEPAEVDGGVLVGLNPGRPTAVKSWAPDRFAALARRIAAGGRRALVLWGPGEEGTARAIANAAGTAAVVAPPTPLADMPALLDACAALVTVDSGLKHLATCVRVPTVTIFGATDPREWHLGGEADAVLWRGLSCSPCRRLACPFGAPCMDVAVAAVEEALAGVLARDRRGAHP
jgi:ADP-heptose:LPS heptosyltransferase